MVYCLCRLCGESKDEMDTQPLFGARSRDIAETIQKYLPIRICRSDTLPKHICKLCVINFFRHKAYIDGIWETELKLSFKIKKLDLSRNELTCPMCAEGKMNVKCGLKFGRAKDMPDVDEDCVIRMLRCDAGLEKTKRNFPFACFTCGEGFSSLDEFHRHPCKPSLPSPQKEIAHHSGPPPLSCFVSEVPRAREFSELIQESLPPPPLIYKGQLPSGD